MKVAIFGLGQAGKVALEFAIQKKFNILYIIDDFHKNDYEGIKVIDFSTFLKNYQDSVDAVLIGPYQKYVKLRIKEFKIPILEVIQFMEVNYKLEECVNFPIKDYKILMNKCLYRDNDNYCYKNFFYNHRLNIDCLNIYNADTKYSYEIRKCLDTNNITLNNNSYISFVLSDKNLQNANKEKIDIKINGVTKSKSVFPNQFYTHFMKKGTNIEVNDNIVLTKPITKSSKKYELILPLFIDAFTYKIFDLVPMKELMPNTLKFFNKHSDIFTNCYSSSEWTTPSVSSIITGKDSMEHKHISRYEPIKFLDNNKTLPEYISENGYTTLFINSEDPLSPLCGFLKGYDKHVYQKEMNVETVINNFIENSLIYKGVSLFSFLSIFELHHDLPNSNDDSIESNINDFFTVEESKNAGFRHKYNKYSVDRYIERLKRLDVYLGQLYSFIENNYKNYLVILFSDHGVSYLDEQPFLFSDKRIKLPLFVKDTYSNNTCANYHKELVSAIDIFSIIIHKSEIENVNMFSSNLPAAYGGNSRKYILAESLYLWQTYKVAIKEKDLYLYFETEEVIQKNVDIELNKHNINTNMDDAILQNYLDLIKTRFLKFKDYIDTELVWL